MVLAYHRILPEIRFNPFRTIVSAETFEAQLDTLNEEYKIIGLGDVIQNDDHDNDIRIAITFDDGCKDNYEYVFPILRKKGLRATFCVVTDFVEEQRPLWDWEIMCRFYHGPDNIQLTIGPNEFHRLSSESRSTFALRVIESLKQCSISELLHTMELLRAQTANVDVTDLLIEAKSMSWEQLGILKENKMEIGSHSGSHRSLARIPLTEAITEIKRSKQQIENHLRCPCVHFAFPFGTVRDHNSALINAVKDSGFRTCLLARHGFNVLSPEVFCMNRIDMYEETDVKYLLN